MSNDKHEQYIVETMERAHVDATFEALLKARTEEFNDSTYPAFANLLEPSLFKFMDSWAGNNGFLNSIKSQRNRGKTLSAKQMRAVANICWRALTDRDLSNVQGSSPVTSPQTTPTSPLPAPTSPPKYVEGQALDGKPSEVDSNLCFTCNKWIVGDYRYLMDVHKPQCGKDDAISGDSTKWEHRGAKNTRNIDRSTSVHNLDLRAELVPKGRYAVRQPDDSINFYQVETMKRKRRLNGRFRWSKYPSARSQYVYPGSILVRKEAGDTKEFVGMQLDTDDFYVGEYEDDLKVVLENPVAAATLYGTEIGRCCYCGRKLTDEDSRDRGMGPDCFEEKHIPYLQARGRAAQNALAQAGAS